MQLVDLGVSIKTSALSFWCWWYGELSLISSRIVEPWRSSPRRVIRIDHRGWTIFDHIGAVKQEAACILFKDLEDEVEILENFFERRQCSSVVVEVSQSLGLRRVIDLPLAAKAGLKRLLQFELDRFTPFSADDVYLACRVVDSNKMKRQMKVEFATVPKVTIDRALSILELYSIPVKRIELEGAQELDFSHCIQPGAKRSFPFRGTSFIAIILCLAFFATAFVKILDQQSELKILEDEIALARGEADEYSAMREQYDEMTAIAQFLENSKSSKLTMTEILAELTQLIPDEAYLVQLVIHHDTIQLHGLADKASVLITALEQSSTFTAPRFNSPVTMDNDAGRERFHLTVQTKADPS